MKKTSSQIDPSDYSMFPTIVRSAVQPYLNIPPDGSSPPAQTDSGANISITDYLHILTQFSYITPFSIGHAAKGAPMYATGKGILSVCTDDNSILDVEMYYSPSASGTIISPDHICSRPHNTYHKFVLESDLDTCQGTMEFFSHSEPTAILKTVRRNGLWYLSTSIIFDTTSDHPSI